MIEEMNAGREPCATCVARKDPHMPNAEREALWDSFNWHTDLRCHESGNPRTAPCVAFLRYKLACKRLPIARDGGIRRGLSAAAFAIRRRRQRKSRSRASSTTWPPDKTELTNGGCGEV
jgi:hypothetical protein